MNINYHVHTPLCNHATGSMTDHIRYAIRCGLREICFLDHLTLNPADGGLSMGIAEVGLYYHAVRVLSRRFCKEIRVKVGLEVDYHPDFTAIIHDIVNTFDFDLIGASVHYLGEKDIVTRGGGWAQGRWDTEAVYEEYVNTLQSLLDHDFFDMICHFDLLKKYGRKPNRSFEREIDGILRKIKEKGLILEVNSSGYGHPIAEAYPSAEILTKCLDMGIPITLGSDAHRLDQLVSNYERTGAFLTALGYAHLSTLSRRCRDRVPINF